MPLSPIRTVQHQMAHALGSDRFSAPSRWLSSNKDPYIELIDGGSSETILLITKYGYQSQIYLDTFTSGINRKPIGDSSGVEHPFEVIGQPGFSGIREVNVRFPTELSRFDPSIFTDLKILRFNGGYYGSVGQDAFPNGLTTLKVGAPLQSNFGADKLNIDYIPSSVTNLNIQSGSGGNSAKLTSAYTDFRSLPDGLEYFTVSGAKEGESFTWNPGDVADGNLVEIKLPFCGKFAVPIEVIAYHPKVKVFYTRVDGTFGGDRRNVFANCRSLEVFNAANSGAIGAAPTDLNGQLPAGEPVMPPNLDSCSGIDGGVKLFNDFRNAANLSKISTLKVDANDRNDFLKGLQDILTGTTSSRNPTGDQISDLSGLTITLGLRFDHTHGGLENYFDWDVWDDLMALGDTQGINLPTINMPNRSVPGQVTAIDSSTNTITVDDPNQDILTFYENAWDLWANGPGYIGRPHFCYLNIDGASDTNVKFNDSTTTKAGSHSNGETTFELENVPSGLTLKTKSTGYVVGDS